MIIEIGVPVYNEAGGITAFLQALQSTLRQCKTRFPDIQFSLLLINDGSTDQTPNLIRDHRFEVFNRIRLISLSRNFGHPAAISAIIDHADGDALVLMDADMQDNPGIIPELVEKYLAGDQSVQVVRTRRSESLFFKISYYVFSKFFTWLSGIRGDVGIFGIYDRSVVHAVRSYPEKLRFMPGIIASVGFRNAYVHAPRDKRMDGETRVGALKLIRLGLLAWISYSSIPIHFITGIGLLLALLSLLGGVLVVAIKLFTELAIPGWASLLSAQFFLGGLIIFSLGVVGQYIGVIFEEVKQRPVYIVASEDELHGE